MPLTKVGHAPHIAKGLVLDAVEAVCPDTTWQDSWTHLAVCDIRRHGVSGREHRGSQTGPFLQAVAFGMRCATILRPAAQKQVPCRLSDTNRHLFPALGYGMVAAHHELYRR
ncbi:hypothetical protein [Acidithiobacillus ferrooxidans]|uniref:hypothetical protein n=1 Tax=Acidithiobacillus ferrooxidans TaxID=920 RepID=UPI001C07B535|nr:hypothetical protein [Acidithiobacillus ferrooxidans]